MTIRNFNTISPSAKSLLLMKGLTNIPFAKEGAEFIMYPEPYSRDAGILEAETGSEVLRKLKLFSVSRDF
ncbi:MAG: hypothetical protein P4L27_02585 [Ignavibacteriaceae bacterium]|nr:hypothetical protein [Ignavibacteriaceae bacterium]